MNNRCIYLFFMHILLGILIFKSLTARRLYKSFGVKGLIACTCFQHLFADHQKALYIQQLVYFVLKLVELFKLLTYIFIGSIN
jgi:hypothetical protein